MRHRELQVPTLGPLLFLLYINDMPKFKNQTKPGFFAENTSLSCDSLVPRN